MNYVCVCVWTAIVNSCVLGEYFTFQLMLIAWPVWKELQPPLLSCQDELSVGDFRKGAVERVLLLL